MTPERRAELTLLRGGTSVTEACMLVGCSSLGSFSSRFTAVMGRTPSAYREAEHPAERAMPGCTSRVVTRRRVSRNGEARGDAAA